MCLNNPPGKGGHSRAMMSIDSLLVGVEPVLVKAGERVLERGAMPTEVLHLDTGRVTLGLMDGAQMEHRLGSVSGPFWLDVSAAVLAQPLLTDVLTDTEVRLSRIPLATFKAAVNSWPTQAQQVLRDVAQAHRQQTELAVSRLAKDAESRCAEWLLHHAQPVDEQALMVQLTQRKRLIAAQLGIAPETLSRVLRHLRERGLISGSGRVVNLVDPTGLRSLAGVTAEQPQAA